MVEQKSGTVNITKKHMKPSHVHTLGFIEKGRWKILPYHVQFDNTALTHVATTTLKPLSNVGAGLP